MIPVLKNVHVELWPIGKLKPDKKNARVHGEKNIEAIKSSLKKFGQQKNIVILKDGTVIAGNGQLQAAKSLGWKKLAVSVFSGTAQEAKAFAIADNRTAELASWDEDNLAEALKSLSVDYDLNDFGFDKLDLSTEAVDPVGEQATLSEYSKKLDTPIYTPKGKKPTIDQLSNERRAAELIKKIKASKISEVEKVFLIKAASRHIVFDYHMIAEYYCHASKEAKGLMEESALVIIDFKKAVEKGYVVLSQEIRDIYQKDYGDEKSSKK